MMGGNVNRREYPLEAVYVSGSRRFDALVSLSRS
jgi:hypothetical protein